jgi:glycolate oxidase
VAASTSDALAASAADPPTATRDLAALAERFARIVGTANVLNERTDRRTYESDALTSHAVMPGLVVLPGTPEEVRDVVGACHDAGVPFVARGSGTGLSAGALPLEDGVLIVLSRLRRIIDVDLPNRRVTVEPGVTNLEVTDAVGPSGLFYAPDPSSQVICSIGGNVAENSGGAHCLKYGFTTNHVTAAEVVLADGRVVHLGGDGVAPDPPGYDLLGAFVGSEGTLGVVTRITVRVIAKPQAVRTLQAAFRTVDDADVIAAGIVPAAVEMMDPLAMEAAEAAVHVSYPQGAGAVLLVELDGPREEVDHLFAEVDRVCHARGAFDIRLAQDERERALFWKGRKSAFAAMGRIARDYYVQDGVVPRTALPEVLREIAALGERAGLRVANVFHAGDGNLHPLVLYDAGVEGEPERAAALAREILAACLDHGGSITGEHGVGADKVKDMAKMFGADDLATMQLVRCAFDPAGLANPGKVFPTPRLCGEAPGPYRRHPLERAGVAERF